MTLAVATDEGGRRVRSEWIAARCRAEGDLACRLLSAACLLEESFSASRLAGVLDMDTGDVAEELDRLCPRRVLSLEDGRFRFRARILRESLADSLSPASRTLLENRISRDGPPGPSGKRMENGTKSPGTGESDSSGHARPQLPLTTVALPRTTARSRPRVVPGLAS